MKVLILNLSLTDPARQIRKILRQYSKECYQALIIDLVFFEPIKCDGKWIQRKILKEYMSDEFVNESVDWMLNFIDTSGAIKLPPYEGMAIGEFIQFDLYQGLLRNNSILLLINRILAFEKPTEISMIYGNQSIVSLDEILPLISLRKIPFHIQTKWVNPLGALFRKLGGGVIKNHFHNDD